MSQWIDKDLFNKFQEQKKNEKDKPSGGSGIRRSELAWRNPDKGTVDKPKVYTGRFLPDPKGQFYKEYHYHMFQIGEQWTFFLCPKTFHFDNYCPFCSVSSKLYTGTKADKSMAYQYSRKTKYVGNWFVINDPRDAETEDDEEKVNGTVKAYEFPSKVEMKIKEQITDVNNGLGPLVFDPGEEGFNFIIKILSTKKDKNNKVWPDYNLSEFSRKPGAIADSDKEIKKIMDSTIDLDEYLEGMERDDEDIIEALKSLMLWDLVAEEWKKAKNVQKASKDEIPEFKKKKEGKTEDTIEEDQQKEEELSDSSTEEEDELSDEALMRELEDL